MAELLLELLSEEIPARMQARAAEDLKRLVVEGLKTAGLSFDAARAFATPRRLALVVDGIPERTEDQTIEKRGPRVGAPDQAIQGFLKGAGLASLDQAEKRDMGKGEFWFAVQRVAGAPAISSVIGIIEDALQSMPWPKSMRWADHKTSWVRPLHSIVAQLDGKGIPVRFYYERSEDAVSNPAKYLQSGDTTRGHRFLSKGEIKVTGFADYTTKLRAAHVVLDPAERKKTILEGAEKLCVGAQVALKADDGLLDEVAGLVEWPVPLIGSIDAEFMDVPPEVLIVSMRTHQRYFATTGVDGALARRFVVIANTVARDGGKTIVEGNERVLRARLSDAKFFWDQDRKTTLESRLPALENIIFHAKLGTQSERAERIARLARMLAEDIPDANALQVEKAARLCKTDLVTGMVGEFPELQGVMGRYYALNDGLPIAVANAIGDHYAPLGPHDRCPTAPVSISLAIADKLQTLAAFWAIEEKPTGSRDPFALRRAALGLIRIIIENKLRIDLLVPMVIAIGEVLIWQELKKSRAARDAVVSVGKEIGPSVGILLSLKELELQRTERLKARGGVQFPEGLEQAVDIAAGLRAFVAERLAVQTRGQGVRHDLVSAVFQLRGEFDLVLLLARVEALQAFLGSDAGGNLLAGYKRAVNIVRAEEKKDKTLAAQVAGRPDVALLEQTEEKAVASTLAEVERSVKPALAREDFAGAMAAFATLRAPIDAFFEKVTVNVTERPELRLNRLKLLNQIRATFDSVADFSKIEG